MNPRPTARPPAIGRVLIAGGGDWLRVHLQLEAGAAQDRPALGGLEGHGCRNAAEGAGGVGQRPDPDCAAAAESFAALAVLWLVFELFLAKENLLTGGEDEIISAFGAFEDAIRIFHLYIPFREIHNGFGQGI